MTAAHVRENGISTRVRPYAAHVLDVTHWPDLDVPVMVLAFSGWVDAGLAGAGAMGVLYDQLRDVDDFATIDLTDHMDLQQTRPTARWGSDGNREIDWPVISFSAGELGRNLILVSGPEPSLHWRAVVDVVVGLVGTGSAMGTAQGLAQ